MSSKPFDSALPLQQDFHLPLVFKEAQNTQQVSGVH